MPRSPASAVKSALTARLFALANRLLDPAETRVNLEKTYFPHLGKYREIHSILGPDPAEKLFLTRKGILDEWAPPGLPFSLLLRFFTQFVPFEFLMTQNTEAVQHCFL